MENTPRPRRSDRYQAQATPSAQAAQPVFPAHLRRMEPAVMGRARRLVAQQIPVRAGIEKRLIRLARFFADRERDGAVGMLRADAPD